MGDIKIEELYVAIPLKPEDKQKFAIRFCIVNNKQIKIVTKEICENILFEMQDANNVNEYYSNSFYAQKFVENKEYLFKKYEGLFNVEELCSLKENVGVEVEYLRLIENTVNEIYSDNLNAK